MGEVASGSEYVSAGFMGRFCPGVAPSYAIIFGRKCPIFSHVSVNKVDVGTEVASNVLMNQVAVNYNINTLFTHTK